MQPEEYFSTDYARARDRFRTAAQAAQAEHISLALAARGPHGEPLSVDIAWRGDRAARRVLLHSSGLHGVEAFAGSAVQLAALRELPAPPPGCAIVLVHVLNPYGMAWLRRANENNVDLNRNFLSDSVSQGPEETLYDKLDTLLNPPGPPANDFFKWRLLCRAVRYGPGPLKQAIAEGQYRHPLGLFFGGHELQPGPASYLDWLERTLQQTHYLFALDLHTGLGTRGGTLLFREPILATTPADELRAALGHAVIGGASTPSRPYRVRGGMGSALHRILPHTKMDFVLQEVGTYGPLTILSALRDENRWHHYGTGGIDHSSKQALLEALCPRSPAWRRTALEIGLGTLRAALSWTCRRG